MRVRLMLLAGLIALTSSMALAKEPAQVGVSASPSASASSKSYTPVTSSSKESAHKASIASDAELVENGEYTNKQGNRVHSPAHTASGKAPEGATAQCGDGTYSFSQSRRGTCSHHGGVGRWL